MVQLYQHLLVMREKENYGSGLSIPAKALEEEWGELWLESLSRLVKFAEASNKHHIRVEAVACTQKAIFIEERRPSNWG